MARIKTPQFLHALLKRWGPNSWKQRTWDSEYEGGQWTESAQGEAARRDSVLDVVEKYSPGAEILELGCGTGATAFQITPNYLSYLGVDISQAAVRAALDALSHETALAGRVSFQVGDMATFVPEKAFSMILFRESIYYIPRPKISGVLRRVAPFLVPAGVFIVRVHDRQKYKGVLSAIEQEYNVVERCLPIYGATATVVFRSKTG